MNLKINPEWKNARYELAELYRGKKRKLTGYRFREDQLDDRAIATIEQTVPVVVQRDNLVKERDLLLSQHRLLVEVARAAKQESKKRDSHYVRPKNKEDWTDLERSLFNLLTAHPTILKDDK